MIKAIYHDGPARPRVYPSGRGLETGHPIPLVHARDRHASGLPANHRAAGWPRLGFDGVSRKASCQTMSLENSFPNLRKQGYQITSPHSLEYNGFDRVAFYAKDDCVTHAARQLANGRWTSKLGCDIDVEHDLPGLEGSVYGYVVQILRRCSSSSACG
jgi:hypothetical protein